MSLRSIRLLIKYKPFKNIKVTNILNKILEN